MGLGGGEAQRPGGEGRERRVNGGGAGRPPNIPAPHTHPPPPPRPAPSPVSITCAGLHGCGGAAGERRDGGMGGMEGWREAGREG